ncbi:INO80 complex subunit D-like [Cynara cardunculus var. scolymus]|nr:INO80 complex subunit D-like [Cynara cardunculus var. scolymus]XP_024985018.1 INO80 complex subunit D-like [Cynara cardunculus var. scolymus]
MASPSTNPSNSPTGMKPAPEDEYLSNCTHLSRQQIIRRRSYNMKQLAKCYRHHYWGLMEELRVRYREYVWKFGMSPFQEEHNEEEKVNVKEEQVTDGIDEAIGAAGNGNGSNNSLLCVFHGCKLKAMTLTNFCQLHILSDPKQQLYKPCDYVIKSAQTGPITCGKPILRSIVPCLCHLHFQKAQQHVSRALKKAGLNIVNTNKVVPKFHVVVTEYVRIIQDRRKNASRANRKNVMPKLEIDN